MKKIFTLLCSLLIAVNCVTTISAGENRETVNSAGIIKYNKNLNSSLTLRGPVTPDNPYPNNTHINYASGHPEEVYIPWGESLEDLSMLIGDALTYYHPGLQQLSYGICLSLKALDPKPIYITYTVYESVESYVTPYGTTAHWHICDDITVYYGSESAENIVFGPCQGPWF